MSFDYPYTCPTIDRHIKDAKDNIQSILDSLISDICPMIPTEVREQIAQDHANKMYGDLEDIFEGVRDTNHQMRRAAEHQVSELESEVSDLLMQVTDLQTQLSEHE